MGNLDKVPQDVPQKDSENIESSKLEWGPELGAMSWNKAKTEIDNLNKKLGEDEKPWRLPTKDELLVKCNKTGSPPPGFQSDFYWSSTISHGSDKLSYGHDNLVYIVSMNYGHVNLYHKDNPSYHVRCVR